MTRARILADYVSSGDELALKAPLASPAFTGTPSITLGSDATGDVYYRAAGGALTRLATGADGTVLTSTGAAAVPAFEALPAAGGITHASQWRINAAFTGSAQPITSNWEEVDAPVGFGVLGASMTESSGVFTFPTEGYWLVDFKPRGRGDSGANRMYGEIYTTHNNSTYATSGVGETWLTGNTDYSTAYTNYIFDVTSTSTHKVKFYLIQGNESNTFSASTGNNYNSVSFIRLGDT